MQRRLIREPEARDYLGGIAHGTMYDLRRRGEIPVLHIGRATFYDVADLDAFIERLREQQGLPPEAAAV